MKLATIAIISEKNKALLVKRAREPFKEFWSFVGGIGAFKYHPDPMDAVKREVKADLDCEFEPNFLNYFIEKSNDPIIRFAFYGKINGDIKINKEYVIEARWFSFDEIKNMKLAFNNNEILNHFLENSKKNLISIKKDLYI